MEKAEKPIHKREEAPLRIHWGLLTIFHVIKQGIKRPLSRVKRRGVRRSNSAPLFLQALTETLSSMILFKIVDLRLYFTIFFAVSLSFLSNLWLELKIRWIEART